MTREELFDKLRPIIMLATGIPECILADPNAPSPRGAYASVEPDGGIVERGQANIHRVAGVWGEAITTVTAQLINSVEINFYRGDARTFAKKLKQANKRPSISLMLHEARIGWLSVSAISDITALQADAREQRAVVSIRIGYEESEAPETFNSIESASWNVRDINDNDLTTDVVTSGVVILPSTNALLFKNDDLLFGDDSLIFQGD
jgi:hypothetical protein